MSKLHARNLRMFCFVKLKFCSSLNIECIAILEAEYINTDFYHAFETVQYFHKQGKQNKYSKNCNSFV